MELLVGQRGAYAHERLRMKDFLRQWTDGLIELVHRDDDVVRLNAAATRVGGGPQSAQFSARRPASVVNEYILESCRQSSGLNP